jgi:tRNA(fMet)-specific endonuclease VapC
VAALIVDTGVLVEVERGQRELDDVVADDDDTAIAAITLAELEVGVRLAATDAQGRLRRAFVNTVLGAVTVIAYDERATTHHADLLVHTRRTGRPRGAHDLMVAATAMATGRTLLTMDGRAFADLPGLSVHVV